MLARREKYIDYRDVIYYMAGQMELARQTILIRELFTDYQKKNPVTDAEILSVQRCYREDTLVHELDFETALRERRAGHHGIASGHLVEIGEPLRGPPGGQPEQLLDPHHEIHAKAHSRPPGQRRMTGV